MEQRETDLKVMNHIDVDELKCKRMSPFVCKSLKP